MEGTKADLSPTLKEEELHHSPSKENLREAKPTSSNEKRVDGKVFFKNVKARVPESKFNEFLLNVKRLNSKVQTKGETLSNVKTLLGKDNDDLY